MNEKKATESHSVLETIKEIFFGYTCEIKTVDGVNGFDFVITVLPVNKRSASVELSERGTEYFRLFCGSATEIEIFGRDKSIEKKMKEIRDICNAVRDGCFKEIVWKAGSKIVRYHSTLEYEGRINVIKDCNLPAYLFLNKHKIETVYEKYGRVAQ